MDELEDNSDEEGSANEKAAIRNAILDAIQDGVLTEDEISKVIKETGAHSRWMNRNSHYGWFCNKANRKISGTFNTTMTPSASGATYTVTDGAFTDLYLD